MEKLNKLTKKFNFTKEEQDLIKCGIDIHIKGRGFIGLDIIDALYKWDKYFQEFKKLMCE